MLAWWKGLAANAALLGVATVFVLEISMSEEIVVLILTGLCVVLLN